MRVLVTGGTGFIGRHLYRRLVNDGHQVFVLTHARGQAGDLMRESGENSASLVRGDLLDYPAAESAVKLCQPSAVFHLASMRCEDAPDGNLGLVLRTNGEGTFNLLKACLQIPELPHVVYASAMSVYNFEAPSYVPVDEKHPISPSDTYGLSKLMGELSCQFFSTQAGLTCDILRISGTFGPGKHKGIVYNSLKAALMGSPVRVHKNEVKRDLISVSDVVEALMLSVKPGTRVGCNVYNIGSGVATSLQDVIDAVERVTGRAIQVDYIEDNYASQFVYDIRKSESGLDFRPRPLEDRIAEFWGSLTANGRVSTRSSTGRAIV